jgi:hypothetical protein
MCSPLRSGFVTGSALIGLCSRLCLSLMMGRSITLMLGSVLIHGKEHILFVGWLIFIEAL